MVFYCDASVPRAVAQALALVRDKRIRTRPGERRRLAECGVRAFAMTGAGNYGRWLTLELLVRRWREIEAVAAAEPGPFIYSVTQSGVARPA